MKVSKALVPTVVLVATIDNYNNQVAANCQEVCNSGLAACSSKCAMFGVFLPGGPALCQAGCLGVYAGCMALCS